MLTNCKIFLQHMKLRAELEIWFELIGIMIKKGRNSILGNFGRTKSTVGRRIRYCRKGAVLGLQSGWNLFDHRRFYGLNCIFGNSRCCMSCKLLKLLKNMEQ